MRNILSEGYYYDAEPAIESKTKLTEIDVQEITWYLKGMKPATPDSEWAFSFPRDTEGNLNPETMVLVGEIQEFGKVRIGKYEYSLSKDDQFLNRKILKRRQMLSG